MSKQKLFILGFHKTITSSLTDAFYILGYRITGSPLDGFDIQQIDGKTPNEVKQLAWQYMPSLLDRYDVFQDPPWYLFDPEQDHGYENSKFILIAPPTENWLQGMVAHFKKQFIVRYEWAHSAYDKAHQEAYPQAYERYIADILQDYFTARPQDLLILETTKPLSWEKICPFLGEDIPSFDFPHENQSAGTVFSLSTRIGNTIRKTFQQIMGQEDPFFVLLRLWKRCHDILNPVESLINKTLDSYRELDQFYSVLNRITEQTMQDVRALKDFLVIEQASTTELVEITSPTTAYERWELMAQDLRHLLGTLDSDHVSLIEPLSGLSVADTINQIYENIIEGQERLENAVESQLQAQSQNYSLNLAFNGKKTAEMVHG